VVNGIYFSSKWSVGGPEWKVLERVEACLFDQVRENSALCWFNPLAYTADCESV
jgi:hypothetical protein